MALSTGQINDAFVNALGRSPTGDELRRYTGRGDLEGSPGQQQLIRELGGTAQNQPVSPEDRATASIEDVYRKLQTEANQRWKDYESSKGPFDLDEILVAKRGEAKEQIDPYYNETLSDYLLGVERVKTRSTQDARDLLSELQATTESFTGSTKLKLTEALGRAREGFADVGLFESGGRLRQEGLLQQETGTILSDFNRRAALKQSQTETGLSRTLQDVGLESTMRQRDIAREQFTGVETRAGELATRAGQKYVQGFAQTLPPELQANTNFDLLKRIGIYA